MVLSGLAQQVLLFLAMGINTLCYILFALDKGYSQRGDQRIPERTLLLVSLLGGAMGGMLAMHQFRHKTRHRVFKYGLPVMLLLQISLIGYFRVFGF